MKWLSIILLLLLSAPAVPEVAQTQPAGESGLGQSTAILREGSYIVDRLGRLGHTPDGQQWRFTFDSIDRAGTRAVYILPNLNLMLMENAIASNSHDIHFKISGMVTEYRGKNYVLLQKVVVVPEEAEAFSR